MMQRDFPVPNTPPWRDSMGPWLVEPDLLDKHYSSAVMQASEEPMPLENIPTPSLTLDMDTLAYNLGAMRDWANKVGVEIAPHGKTTMAPALWRWQLDAGAWAISVANIFQLRIARYAQVPRVIVANEIVTPDGLAWLGRELSETDPASFDVICWTDSLAGVELMENALRRAGADRPLGVSVELGAWGSRTGARDLVTAREIAVAVRESDLLELRGIAAYEGSVPAPESGDQSAAVREFLSWVYEGFVELADLYETSEPLLSAGGSAWFDIVAEELAPAARDIEGTHVVLRSGAYVVHDHGHYKKVTPNATRSGPEFQPAAHAYSRILSSPEPGLALLDAGKRDVPYDLHLPRILGVRRNNSWERIDATVVKTDDQHAYVRVPDGELKVGEMVRLGLSHPCTIFDKWRSVLLVEDEQVVGSLPTYF